MKVNIKVLGSLSNALVIQNHAERPSESERYDAMTLRQSKSERGITWFSERAPENGAETASLAIHASHFRLEIHIGKIPVNSTESILERLDRVCLSLTNRTHLNIGSFTL